MIKLLLLAALALALGSALRNRNTVRFQAGKKVMLLLFVLLAVAAVVRPDLVTTIANAVGVGRGSDLLLYILVMAFLFVVLNVYLKFKDADAREADLVRVLAIAEARVSMLEQRLERGSAAGPPAAPPSTVRKLTRPARTPPTAGGAAGS